ncbi:MAG TPA: hypothetical protein VIX12_02880 [Candidatus Binataceae bacterium]
MSDEPGERTRREIGALIREHARPAANQQPAGPQISVTGSNNVVATGNVKIVMNTPPPQQAGRAANVAWREEMCAAIRMRASELKLTEEQILDIAAERLHRHVQSLSALSARDLGRLYDAMHWLQRPALD